MFEKLITSYFWPSIIAALALSGVSAFWIGTQAIIVAALLPATVAGLWIGLHLWLVPAPTEDLGLKIFGGRAIDESEASS